MNRFEILEQFVVGKLNPDAQGNVETHVETCACCLDLLAALSSDSLIERLLKTSVEVGPLSEREAALVNRLKMRTSPAPSHETYSSVPFVIAGLVAEQNNLRILKLIGRGGFGAVYKAYDELHERTVAVKIPAQKQSHNAHWKENFLKEARNANRVKDQHVLQVLQFGEVGNFPYLIMEFADGGSLADSLRDSDPFQPREAALIVRDIARGADALNGEGVVHRDINPSNVLIDHGSYKLADFGLCFRSNDRAETTLTPTPAGTLPYMSPQQINGEDPDARTDVYSLGVVLYELLFGRRPFLGSRDEVRQQILNSEPAFPRGRGRVPGDLQEITRKCLAKSPERRYQSAAALADDLDRWLSGEPITAKPVPAVERLWLWIRRKPALAACSIAGPLIAVALVALSVGSLLENRTLAEINKTVNASNELLKASVAEKEQHLEMLRGHVKDLELAGTLSEKAVMHMDVKDFDAARNSQEAANKIFERIPKDASLVQDVRHQLATGYYNLALIEKRAGKSTKAAQLCHRAIALWTELCTDQPQNEDYGLSLMRAYNNLGSAQFSEFDPKGREQAVAAYAKAVGQAVESRSRSARPAEYDIELARTLLNLARVSLAGMNLEDKINQPVLPKLVEWYSRAIELLTDALQQEVTDSDQARKMLLDAYKDRLRVFDVLKRNEEAVQDLDVLIQRDDPANRTGHRLRRAWTNAKAGNSEAAVSEAENLIQNEKLTGEDLFNMACTFSLAAGSTEKATDLDAASKRELAESYKQRAMEILQHDATIEFLRTDKKDHLSTDSDLDPLRRSREDFKELRSKMGRERSPQGR